MRTLLVAIVVLAACGDDSGVDADKLVIELSESEVDDLCNYVIEKQGDGTVVECDEGEVVFPTFEECVADYLSYDETCVSTVRNEEECARALAATPCGDPVSCEVPYECGS